MTDIIEVIDAYLEGRWLKWATVFCFGASVGAFFGAPWPLWSIMTGIFGACLILLHLTRDE